jgi:hypothetical protein
VEFDDFRAFGMRQQFIQGTHRDHLSLVHDAQAIAQTLRFLHVVRGVQDGGSGRAQTPNQLQNVRARLRVDARGRFVKQDQFGFMHQRRREIQPPLHPARERSDVAITVGFQADEAQQLLNASSELRALHSIETAEKPQVLRRGQARVKGGFLRRQTNHLPHRGGFVADAAAKQDRVAARRAALRGKHRNSGGLTRAVGAKQAENFALRDVEAQSRYCCGRAIALAEALNAQGRRRRKRLIVRSRQEAAFGGIRQGR